MIQKNTLKIKAMGIKIVTSFISPQRGMWSGILLFLLLYSTASFGQIKVRPLATASKKNISKKTHTASRTKEIAPLSLPFFDDFSQPLAADTLNNMFPDPARWDTSYSVWITSGMAINSPTINVATFDGLDSAGFAYSPNDTFLDGYTDSLTSQKIDLSSTPSGTNPNPVLESERNSVYISFFYQWRGNGEAPNAVDDDRLELLFRNDLGKWETIQIISPDETFQRDVFYKAIVQITGDQFFHDAFQFQFKSFGRRSGPFDTWNLDYVYLNKGRNASDLSFPDRAAASTVSPLFKPYSAMPYSHFLITRQMDSVRFDVQNLMNGLASTNYSADAEIISYKDGTPFPFYKPLVVSQGVKGAAGAMGPMERVSVKLSNLPDANNSLEFDPDADSVDVQLKMTVLSGDSIEYRINDTISATYNLRNFYAYDDGTAEYAIELIETGNFLAYEFNLPPDLPDTLALLESIDIYLPPYGLPNIQNVDFYVFAPNTARGVPGARLLTVSSYPLKRQGVNEFQRIRFLPALALDTVDTYYIGWKQPVSGDVLVGLDNSNDTGSKIFVNTEGNNAPDANNAVWESTLISGSLMIRPIFGTGTADPTTGIEDDEITFAVYPNPTTGNFYIEGRMDKLEILSMTGQPVPFYHDGDAARTFVQMNVSSGLYLLRCTKAGVTRTHKLMITR